MKRLLLVLLMCLPCWAANDFTGDPNCLAVWNFESGALTTDSQGSHTLSVAQGTPAADTVNYKQGSSSVFLDWLGDGPAYNIADANLAAGFPLKGGSGSHEFSILFWVRPASENASYFYQVWSKDQTGWTGGHRFATNGGANTFNLKHTAQSAGVNGQASLITANQWYHIACVYDPCLVNGTMSLYEWDDTASTLYTHSSANQESSYGSLVTTAVPFWVGGSDTTSIVRTYHGRIDEFVVFNRALTVEDVNDIRDGNYIVPAATGTSNWWWRRRHNN